MGVVNNARRYRGLKARAAYKSYNLPIAFVYRQKQANTPGTPLPDDFPYITKLHSSPAMLYTCYEDLDGVTLLEFSDLGINSREADKIVSLVNAHFGRE